MVGGGAFEPAAAQAPGFAKWSYSKLVDSAMALPIAARVTGAGGAVIAERSIAVTTVLAAKPDDGSTAERITSPPTITFQRPQAGLAVVVDATGKAKVDVAVEARPGGRPIARVEILADGAPVEGVSVTQGASATLASASVPLAGLGPHAITARAVDGELLQSEATVAVAVVPEPVEPPVVERLFLVEKCRLVTFAGAFSAGQVVKIVTLAPTSA